MTLLRINDSKSFILRVNDFLIGTPKVSGEFGIPEPYNSNDLRVMKKFICKYLCKENNRFNKDNFLKLIKNNTYHIGSYPILAINDGITNLEAPINKLIVFCLNNLQENYLVVYDTSEHKNTDLEQFMRSEILELFCANIDEYDISIMEEFAISIRLAESELKKENPKLVVSLLERLAKNSIALGELPESDSRIISRLNQLGLVNITLDDNLNISFVGKKYLSLVLKKEGISRYVSSKVTFQNISIMLLGSAESNSILHRRTIKKELQKYKFKQIIIMEETDDKETDKSLDDKFRRITEDLDPNFFIAIYHEDAKMDGVAFEIGWLCCQYHAKELTSRLRILSQNTYDWNKTTSYIKSLFSNVLRNEFDETKEYSKASRCIKNFIINSVDL